MDATEAGLLSWGQVSWTVLDMVTAQDLQGALLMKCTAEHQHIIKVALVILVEASNTRGTGVSQQCAQTICTLSSWTCQAITQDFSTSQCQRRGWFNLSTW